MEFLEYKALLESLGQAETDLPDVKHILKEGQACYMRKHHNGVWGDEKWIKFTIIFEYWEFVVSKTREKAKLYLFCHNTAFDVPILDFFHELPRYGFTLRSAIIDAPPTVLRFVNGTRSIVVIDTLNFWRMPLAQLGTEIGLPKLDMPDNNDMGVEWETYNKRDVEILRTACIKWWDFLAQNDFGSFANTLAAQSMRVYRHKYMKHTIFIDDNERALKLTRSGYYGGRVECFRIGRYKQKTYALDINAMYPAQMYRYSFPNKLVTHTKHASISDLQLWLSKYSICARVSLNTDKPFAPYRGKNKLYFPTGRFETVLSTPEIKYALDYAKIEQIHEVAVYSHAPLFHEMMRDMSAMKAEYKRMQDFVKEFLIKKLINSFYGKWGQSGGKWIEAMLIDDLSCKRWINYDVESGELTHYRQLGGLLQKRDTETESTDSFPAIAAHVTAYARMHLWRMIEQAGLSNCFYCDTDCVLVNEQGKDNLAHEIDDFELGKLKVIGEYDDIEIWGCKDYRWGKKEKHKGVNKKAHWIDSHKIRQERWSGLRGMVSAGDITAPRTRTIIKNLQRIYDKGVVLQDGTVLPHRLQDLKNALS